MNAETRKRQERYYALVLDDCACPSFCSAPKAFHGRLSDIRGLVEALANDNADGHHNEVLNAFHAWEQGDLDVMHRVAYSNHKLLTQEEVVAQEDYALKHTVWQHTNIWGCVNELQADAIDVSQIVLKQGDWYLRCIRPVFRDLMVRTPEAPITQMREWKPVGDRFWGYPHIMVQHGKYTYPRLYMDLQHYSDLSDALRDLKDASKIDYATVMDEVFGDG